MSETTITPAMIEAYQRQQAEAEQQRRHQLINDLVAAASQAGYEIVAVPQFAPDGRTVAVWGVQPQRATQK